MMRTATIFCLAAVCVANPLLDVAKVQELDPHIVGGWDANIEHYPYQVSLMYSSSHICGASIIKESWALTAAHCMVNDRTRYSIRAGSSLRTSGGTVHIVSKVTSHQRYDANTFDYDFALLKVATPFTFRAGVAVIKLPKQGQNTTAHAYAAISGWGALSSSSGSLPNQLQVVNIPVRSQQECRVSYGQSAITDRMICAGRPLGGVDSCQGDSGGPMAFNNELIGVVSWGQGCALPGRPGVYAKVSSVRDWIDANAATSVSPVNLLATLCLLAAVVAGQSHT